MTASPGELRALLAKATPGPYDAFKPDMIRAVRDDVACPLFDVLEPWGEFAKAAPTVRHYDGSVAMRANSEGARISAALRQQHANCDYLLAALNALPGLLDRIEALEEALEPFAWADIDVSGTAAIGVTGDDIARAQQVLNP